MAAVDVVGPNGERGRMSAARFRAMESNGWRLAETVKPAPKARKSKPAAAPVVAPEAAPAVDPTPTGHEPTPLED